MLGANLQPCAGDDSNNDGLMCVAGHVPSVQMGYEPDRESGPRAVFGWEAIKTRLL